MDEQLAYVRLTADEVGDSHIERDLAVSLTVQNFVPPAPAISVSALQQASACAFLSVPSGYFGDWHPSPKRQWLVFISGRMEFETSDGARFLGRPGSVVLLEDTVGPGHRSWVPAGEPAVMLAVQI